jgi:hypothetical protein
MICFLWTEQRQDGAAVHFIVLPQARRGNGRAGVSPRRGQHVPHAVVAIAHHQTVAVLVDLIGELLDVGADLGLQRRRQHLPGTIANDLIKQ